jgi:hypothetical protein
LTAPAPVLRLNQAVRARFPEPLTETSENNAPPRVERPRRRPKLPSNLSSSDVLVIAGAPSMVTAASHFIAPCV